MATLNLRSLKTLLWVKQRRLEELERLVQAQVGQVAAAEAALAQAEERRLSCVADEEGCVAQIAALSASDRFIPEQIVTLGHVLHGLVEATRLASSACEQASLKVNEARQQLAQLRQAQQRAERQYEQLEERRERRLKEIDQEGEDLQDEESEEAAVARRVGQRRDEERIAA